MEEGKRDEGKYQNALPCSGLISPLLFLVVSSSSLVLRETDVNKQQSCLLSRVSSSVCVTSMSLPSSSQLSWRGNL